MILGIMCIGIITYKIMYFIVFFKTLGFGLAMSFKTVAIIRSFGELQAFLSKNFKKKVNFCSLNLLFCNN